MRLIIPSHYQKHVINSYQLWGASVVQSSICHANNIVKLIKKFQRLLQTVTGPYPGHMNSIHIVVQNVFKIHFNTIPQLCLGLLFRCSD
jgi:hypothetical protein